MSSTLSTLFVMGLYPSSGNSYDILAVYRPESRSECVLRVHARLSFDCDPSGGSILERSPRAARSAPLPPSHLAKLCDDKGLCTVLSVLGGGGGAPRRKGSTGSFNYWRVYHVCQGQFPF